MSLSWYIETMKIKMGYGMKRNPKYFSTISKPRFWLIIMFKYLKHLYTVWYLTTQPKRSERRREQYRKKHYKYGYISTWENNQYKSIRINSIEDLVEFNKELLTKVRQLESKVSRLEAKQHVD